MSVVIADTGVLVALLDRREKFHAWTVGQAGEISPPLLVCEPVLAEVCFLLAGLPGARAAVRHNLAVGAWRIDFDLPAEYDRVFDLMETYADQPMSLADACLVRMSELRQSAIVFTLDRHFRVYRRNRRQVIPLLIPPEF